MAPEDIAHRFAYHSPTPERAIQHEEIRAKCRALAIYLNDVLPEGREKSLAMTHVEETMLWSNASLARS